MKFCIPSVGDKIILTEDWTFNILTNYANYQLAAYLGYSYYNIWFKFDNLAEARKIIRQNINRNDFYIDRIFDRESYDEAIKLAHDLYEYKLTEIGGVRNLVTMLPKGTILSVDRFSIKRGKSDDYIVFSTKNLGKIEVPTMWWRAGGGTKTVTSVKFMAKLEDCHNIEFEKVEKKEKKIKK